MSCVAGISVSPNRVTVEVRNLDDGDRLAVYSVPVTSSAPQQQGELAVEDVLPAFEQALADTAAHHPVALALAGPLHALVVTDGAGAVIRPALLATDDRSAPDAGWCNKKIAPESWAESVGSVPTAVLTVTKLSWLHRSEVEAWERIARFAALHDYLRSRLCDGALAFVTDRGTASGTGYWSARNQSYVDDVLMLIDKERAWTGAVPEVADATIPVGTRGSSKVAVGTADLMAMAIALGIVPGDVLVSVGDRALVSGVSSAPIVDETGVIASFAAADAGYLPTVTVPHSGKVAEIVDGALLAMSTLSTAGVDVSGRLIICGEESVCQAVARAASAREMRAVDLCSDAAVVAAGAAVQAAACALGQWPQWQAVPTVTV